MKNMTLTAALLLLVCLTPFLCTACADKMEEHYEVPQWLKGSAWEVLEQRGNFSTFLAAAERAGFRPLMEGKSILTVMAPDDAAFATYLAKHGYTDIAEIDASELQKLIGFHLLYYSYNKSKLVNFRPEGDLTSDEMKERNAGLYYKFRTRSSSKPTEEIESSTGRRRTVYHLDRFLPVFSYRFFDSKQLDAASNYTYFYPGSTWKGTEGFNVSNAAVGEYEILADNGYIYTVDQVIEPLETIYTHLSANDRYSIFLQMYDENSTYTYDATLSKDFGAALGTDSLFLHTHGTSLPAIAMEWYSTRYADVADNASKAYSIFAPSDEAMNNFFSAYWEKGGYESLSDVDNLAMKYMLNQFVYAGGIVFPDEITGGKVKNVYDMVFNFNPTKVKDRSICVNGVFYGLSELETPVLFASVVGPAFRNKLCNYYLYMLHGAGLIGAYASQDAKYVLLMPTNEQIETEGIFLRTYAGGSRLQQETEDGLVDLSTAAMRSIVNMHTVTGIEGLKSNGTQILATQTGFNYWYVKEGKITVSAAYNRILEPDNVADPFVAFSEIEQGNGGWNNGKTYAYEGEALFQAQAGDGLQQRLSVCNDSRYAYYQFAQLLQKAGMVLPGNQIAGLGLHAHTICFIPTNQAVSDAMAAGQIPGMNAGGKVTDASALRTYLHSYFLRDLENAITTYPYPGSAMKNGVYTAANGKALTYTDSGSALSVTLGGKTVHVVSDYDFFPFAFNDGCFQLIDALF